MKALNKPSTHIVHYITDKFTIIFEKENNLSSGKQIIGRKPKQSESRDPRCHNFALLSATN